MISESEICQIFRKENVSYLSRLDQFWDLPELETSWRFCDDKLVLMLKACPQMLRSAHRCRGQTPRTARKSSHVTEYVIHMASRWSIKGLSSVGVCWKPPGLALSIVATESLDTISLLISSGMFDVMLVLSENLVSWHSVWTEYKLQRQELQNRILAKILLTNDIKFWWIF